MIGRSGSHLDAWRVGRADIADQSVLNILAGQIDEQFKT